LSAHVARGHVAVGVIRIRVPVRETRHRVLVGRVVGVGRIAFVGEIAYGWIML
jgi:hypothetical protein